MTVKARKTHHKACLVEGTEDFIGYRELHENGEEGSVGDGQQSLGWKETEIMFQLGPLCAENQSVGVET